MVAAAKTCRPRSFTMSSRTIRRSTVLAVAVSLGMCLASSEAGQARNRAGSVLREELSLRTFVQHVISSLRSLAVTKSDPPPPNNPGNQPGNNPENNNSGSGNNQEGSSGCPLGRPSCAGGGH